MMNRRLGTRGDTIIEVLIAITIASSVLGAAYVIVHRTTANSRQAQEHSEALGIAQSQLEQIQALSSTGNVSQLEDPLNVQHCFDTGGNLKDITPLLSSLPSNNDSDVSRYPSGCSGLGDANFYRTAFKYFNGNTFIVYVDWPSATGQGDDHVSLSYHAYRGGP
jgi:type II secretory pathway pseudopilin PulG